MFCFTASSFIKAGESGVVEVSSLSSKNTRPLDLILTVFAVPPPPASILGIVIDSVYALIVPVLDVWSTFCKTPSQYNLELVKST